jgi:basic membrane lipoprotein Med (substrate-binding protein (PBP1-ABC) superfamily)
MPGLAQSLDDGAEVGFTAGYAAGLLLEDVDSSTAAMIGCCDLNFEKEFLLSFEMGIKAVSADNSVTYIPTGDFPYDFDNVPNSSEAFNNVVADGAGVILPYLGGAHEAVVQLSNESGVPVLSAGASDVCTREGDLTWDVAVRFDGGDYVAAIFPLIFSGAVQEGQTKVFQVGIDPEPGAVICNATDSQQAAMDSMYADVASGMYAGDFGAIKGCAYAGYCDAPEVADFSAFDSNGDGSITIGVAAAGPADDGAYYQAVVDAAILLSEENGFNSPIVIDEIKPADAAIELTNLADQGVDIIIVGASEIAEPLTDLTEEYPEIFWYCNCGAGFPEMPGLAQSLDDGAEVGFTAGYAAGLLLEDVDSSTAAMIGCCDLNFEKEFLLSFEMGIKAVSADNSVTYIPTGDFPYDFDNVPNSSEAFNNVVADGAGVILPYLGGAHEAVVQLSNESGVPVLSAGASDVCTREGDLTWDVAVRFDGGDYVAAIFPLIFSGAVQEGQTKVFQVGIDPEPGAVICNATDSQQAAMDSMYADVASGMYAGDFGAIKGQAYGGG